MLQRGLTSLLGEGVVGIEAAAALLDRAEHSHSAKPEALPPEARLLVAERCLDAGRPELARASVDKFLGTRPAQNQFLARAYFVVGRVLAAEVGGLRGSDRRTAVLAAVAQVERGIALAGGGKYSFLVHNGSVVLWSIARPLLSQRSADAASALAEVLERTLSALGAVGETDASWRLHLTMELARCLEMAGRGKEAAAMLAKDASPLAADAPPRLKLQLCALQARLLAEDSAAIGKLRAEASSAGAAIAAAQQLRDGADVQSATAMAISGAESLDPRLAEALRVEGGAEAVRSAVAALGGDCGEEQGEALGCLAMKAAQYGALDVAAGLAVRAGTSSRSGARTRANLTEQMLRVASLGTASEVLSREGVSVRVGAVRAVDKTLRAARREDDAELIEDIVALLFNIARPLLQPELVGLDAPRA